MYSKETLDYFIYGRNADGELGILGISGEIQEQAAKAWHNQFSFEVEPLPVDSVSESRALGILKGMDSHDLMLVEAHFPEGDPEQPMHRFIRIPVPIFQMVSGNFSFLLESVRSPVEWGEPFTPIYVPNVPTWTKSHRLFTFEWLVKTLGKDSIPELCDVLNAALDNRHVVICDFRSDLDSRLQLVQALMLLLPTSARSSLTFSTHTTAPDQAQARIVFSKTVGNSTRWQASIPGGVKLKKDAQLPAVPYVKYLKSLWQGNLETFVIELHSIDMIASQVMGQKSLHDGLTAIAERGTLDRDVKSDTTVVLNGAALKEVLSSPVPLEGDQQGQYIKRLLEYALQERDLESVNLIAGYMTEDEAIHRLIFEELTTYCVVEPDAVYFFVRTLMSEGTAADWLPMLHSAASAALQVAIDDGDNQILMEWLQLVAREPASYELGDILQEGILAAQQRTHEDGEFGSSLIKFVAKRKPNLIDTLLDDPLLVQKASDPLGMALNEYHPSAVHECFEMGKEIQLIVLGRAAMDAPENAAASALFSAPIVDHLWALYTANASGNMLPHYQPAAIIESIVNHKVIRVGSLEVETLLRNMIVAQDVEFFRRITRILSGEGDLSEPLYNIFRDRQFTADTILIFIGQIVEDQTVTQQTAINIYVKLCVQREWASGTLPLVERISRRLQQNAGLEVPLEVLWKMLAVASTARVELIVRSLGRRILAMLGNQDNPEAKIVDALVRLHEQLFWSTSAIGHVLTWWREYAHAQSLGRLQQWEKALDGKKPLEEERSIVQTIVGVRKMMGNRSIAEFADDVNSAYRLLEAISESFDPVNKGSINFDPSTVRAELDAHDGALAPDETSVLAKNLRELAQLIITMADHRSKSTLMRREGDIERQLLAGEQEPQSAIDTMKWMSGYLSDKFKEAE